MTTPIRFEPELSRRLADLYVTGTPDYRDDLLQATARVRQRPAWSFPERWLPMADYAGSATFAPRMPWRTIAVALLVLALAAAAAIYVGSRATRVPAPFGPARNGVIAYSAAGDIFTADPVTGETKAIVSGPELDRRPSFSPDGTKLAFLRERSDALARFDLVVAAKDGSGQRVLTKDPITTDSVVEWAPDGTYLIVTESDGLVRYDATGASAPIVLATDVNIFPGAFRPPDGAQLLVEIDTADTTALYTMATDGSDRRLIIQRPAAGRLDSITANARWSPDGSKVVFGLVGPTDSQSRLHVVDIDGTGLHRVGTESGIAAPGLRPTGDGTGIWVENDVAVAPDGSRVAFNRWEQDPSNGTWQIRPIGVAPIAGGMVQDMGPAPVPEGAIIEWSPDSSQIVTVPGPMAGAPADGTSARPTIIDTARGSASEASWGVGSGTSWQRLAQ